MAKPGGYRKALRLMDHADRFNLPIISFIDTPGAYAGGSASAITWHKLSVHGLKSRPREVVKKLGQEDVEARSALLRSGFEFHRE